jgi:predicted RNase H-like HicB family nuclease
MTKWEKLKELLRQKGETFEECFDLFEEGLKLPIEKMKESKNESN